VALPAMHNEPRNRACEGPKEKTVLHQEASTKSKPQNVSGSEKLLISITRPTKGSKVVALSHGDSDRLQL
jgi:hypothetical protein